MGYRSIDGSGVSLFEDEGDRITLQVGERRFNTLRQTLMGGSSYFTRRLSAMCDYADADSYFIDADPDLFEHILRYLRSSRFPVFFDCATLTFDLAKYAALLVEARYFGVDKLADWIENKTYLRAVKLERSVRIIHNAKETTLESLIRGEGSTKVDIATSWTTKEVHLCPRNIQGHKGNRDLCDYFKCQEFQPAMSGEIQYEHVRTLSAAVVTTRVMFDPMY
ncbi:hypothetical protein F5Y05DRAFT_424772 [Hypoxylon sp. FL0543]|nr:hypothetical protein F5Y05DRAFT_424772 [Hypoxylon sp. FL0543]